MYPNNQQLMPNRTRSDEMSPRATLVHLRSNWVIVYVILSLLMMGLMLTCFLSLTLMMMISTPNAQVQQTNPTLPPHTPLAAFINSTATYTLIPLPTAEPPTPTLAITAMPMVPSNAVERTEIVLPQLEGIYGLPTVTLTQTTTPCEPRDDWENRYEVQTNDALATIATRFNTYVDELAEANCIEDVDLIRVGQILRVPGRLPTGPTAIPCLLFVLQTPMNGAFTVQGAGQLVFNWQGPLAPRNLIRVIQPDGTLWERLIEGRQHETIDLARELPQGGVHTWYVYPLGMDFLQFCPEGGPWTFHKEPAPTPTPTIAAPVVIPTAQP